MSFSEAVTSILIVYLYACLMIPVIEHGDREKRMRR